MPDFLQLLKSKHVFLLDGAIGTELDRQGLMGRGRVNLDAPQAVVEVHRAYVQAGSGALITNTLTTIVCIVFQTDANGGRTMMGDAASLRTCNRRGKDATMEVNPHPIIRKKAYQDLGQTQLWEGNS